VGSALIPNLRGKCAKILRKIFHSDLISGQLELCYKIYFYDGKATLTWPEVRVTCIIHKIRKQTWQR